MARLIGIQLAVLLFAGCQGTSAGGTTANLAVSPDLPPLDSGTIAAARADYQTPGARVLVMFTHPESFLDIRDREAPTQKGQDEILESFRDYLTRRAVLYLPSGNALYLNFMNIKLAGGFPYGSLGNRAERVILESTPPILRFAWAVTDPSGRVIRSGYETLEDINFMELYRSADPGDPYRYEKAVLDDWLRNRLQA